MNEVLNEVRDSVRLGLVFEAVDLLCGKPQDSGQGTERIYKFIDDIFPSDRDDICVITLRCIEVIKYGVAREANFIRSLLVWKDKEGKMHHKTIGLEGLYEFTKYSAWLKIEGEKFFIRSIEPGVIRELVIYFKDWGISLAA